MNFKW